MMRFTAEREELLKPLQTVIGAIERQHTIPILANVLIVVDDEALSITATDLEVELIGKSPLEQPIQQAGSVTVPGRKLMDICRALPEQTQIDISVNNQRVTIKSGKSRFTLSSLPTEEFPEVEQKEYLFDFVIKQAELRRLTEKTAFAVAQQDVRHYLNGMLLEINEGMIRAVATDGHRLAMNSMNAPVINDTLLQIIVPRKGIFELVRLLDDHDQEVSVGLSNNHIRVTGENFVFTSKLIDSKYPDYRKILPKGGDRFAVLDREELKKALLRVSILANEKMRGVYLQFRSGLLRVLANNPEQEEAEDVLQIEYAHEDNINMGFNVSYLTDVLSAIDSEKVKFTFSDDNTSVLVEGLDSDGSSVYVVMPMRL